jgi:hypothetical protein
VPRRQSGGSDARGAHSPVVARRDARERARHSPAHCAPHARRQPHTRHALLDAQEPGRRARRATHGHGRGRRMAAAPVRRMGHDARSDAAARSARAAARLLRVLLNGRQRPGAGPSAGRRGGAPPRARRVPPLGRGGLRARARCRSVDLARLGRPRPGTPLRRFWCAAPPALALRCDATRQRSDAPRQAAGSDRAGSRRCARGTAVRACVCVRVRACACGVCVRVRACVRLRA